MKSVLAFTALTLLAAFSEAKVSCSISNESIKGSQSYDHAIYNGFNEGTEGQKMFVITEEASSAIPFNLERIKKPQQLKLIDGKTWVSIFYKDDKVSLSAGTFNAATAAKNLTPLTATTSGKPTNENPVALILPEIAIVCVGL